MTAAELRDFIFGVRREAEDALAQLATVDVEELPPDVRAEYEQVCAGWHQFLALTEGEAVALHEAACIRAGRELTPDELRGLLGLQ
jgi:hypothetical protein